jgi:hypothetical protein
MLAIVRELAIVFSLLFAAPCVLRAQDVDVDALRARARSRGWQTSSLPGEELWCPQEYRACLFQPDGSEEMLVIGSPAGRLQYVHMRERRGEWTVQLSIDLRMHQLQMRIMRPGDTVRIEPATVIELPIGAHIVHLAPEDPGEREAWSRAELRAFLASPRAFRNRLARRDRQLRAYVERNIGTFTICERPQRSAPPRDPWGPKKIGAPFCVRRPLDDGERSALLARLDEEISRRAVLAREYAGTWNAMLRAMLARR